MLSSSFLKVKARALDTATPLSVHLELTHRCTWSCSFCYNPDRGSRGELPADRWIDVLDQLRRMGTLFLTLTGGEPLLHPGFFAISEAARARYFALRVFTNGSLIDTATAAAIASLHPLSVELPCHGARPETHDRATGNPGSFTAVLTAAAKLRASGARPTLKMLLTRDNEHELDDVVALAARLGATLRVDPTLTPRDDGDCAPLALEASDRGLGRLMTHLQAVGRLPFVCRSAGSPNCGVGRLTMAIDPYGDVFPCIQWRHSSLGNICSSPLCDMWRWSPVRSEAAAASDGANTILRAMGWPASAAPFCPAAEALRTGSPLPQHELRSPFIRCATIICQRSA